MPDTLTTELEAVNVCLSTIGEAPVNSLTGTLPADVAIAQSVLTEVRRKVCGYGWWFNEELKVQTTLDEDGEIILATNVLRAELTYPVYNIALVQRGTRLYNSYSQTYTFTSAPKLNLVYLLDWSELPEQARQYIMHQAARIFQARVVGAPELDQAASRDEVMALVNLKSADSDARNRNIFNAPNLSTYQRYRYRRPY
jgi:hypothetical protein